MNVSVVITCWNGRQLLEKNLPEIIKASENPKNRIKEIIVVDDFSSDDSVDFLRKNFPKVRVITQNKNYGYAVTCNTGVSRAKNELVVILNADVIPSENFLEAAIPLFNDDKVFAVTFNEGTCGPGKLIWEKGFWEIEATSGSVKTALSDWASGGSSVFRKKIWKELEGMDELFLPFYFEDADLGLRAKKAGYLCLWEPQTKVQHKHESTINKETFKKFQHRRNISLIKERNHLLLTWKNLENASLRRSHLFGLLKRILAHPGYVKVVLTAFTQLVLTK